MSNTNSDINTNKLKVIFAGTPDFAATSLSYLIAQQQKLNIDIVAVYTQPDRKAGRGQKLTASPVKQVALANDICVEQPSTFKKSTEEGLAARETLRSYDADVMIVAAYGLILPVGVLQTPKYGCLNIHASLLPRWRGAAPIHRALLAGDEETGITIMQMDKGLDTGDMLYKVSCLIHDTDTTATLHDTLADMGAEAITTVIANLSHYQDNANKQDDTLACYAEKLSKEEGRVDWTQTAEHIARQIRGMHPYPGTYTFLEDKRIKILSGLPVLTDQLTDQAAGTVIDINKEYITVACGKANDSNQHNTLRLTKLQFAGSKPATAEQVANGNQLKINDIFV